LPETRYESNSSAGQVIDLPHDGKSRNLPPGVAQVDDLRKACQRFASANDRMFPPDAIAM
jgi:hypothetical protein